MIFLYANKEKPNVFLITLLKTSRVGGELATGKKGPRRRSAD